MLCFARFVCLQIATAKNFWGGNLDLYKSTGRATDVRDVSDPELEDVARQGYVPDSLRRYTKDPATDEQVLLGMLRLQQFCDSRFMISMLPERTIEEARHRSVSTEQSLSAAETQEAINDAVKSAMAIGGSQCIVLIHSNRDRISAALRHTLQYFKYKSEDEDSLHVAFRRQSSGPEGAWHNAEEPCEPFYQVVGKIQEESALSSLLPIAEGSLLSVLYTAFSTIFRKSYPGEQMPTRFRHDAALASVALVGEGVPKSPKGGQVGGSVGVPV